MVLPWSCTEQHVAQLCVWCAWGDAGRPGWLGLSGKERVVVELRGWQVMESLICGLHSKYLGAIRGLWAVAGSKFTLASCVWRVWRSRDVAGKPGSCPSRSPGEKCCCLRQNKELEEGRRRGSGVGRTCWGCFSAYKGLFFFFLFVIIFKIFAILAVFILTLLMYNSHTIQFTHLKYTIPISMIFSVFTELFSHYHGWHPTPVLLPGKSHGRRSLVGCSPWGR